MRAALLPSIGEPFLLAYWLRNFETWRDAVDELLVYVNPSTDPGIAGEMIAKAGGRFDSTPYHVQHGGAIRWLLENTQAETVVLCEEDAYCRDPEWTTSAFERIESDEIDIIGAPRLEDKLNDLNTDWPQIPTGEAADLGRALWPTFLFARRDVLLATDRRFAATVFHLGEYIPGLGVVVTPEHCFHVGVAPDYIFVDTFYGTTYQLRPKRIELIHRTRLWQAEAVEDWLRYNPPWFHISGLSTIRTILDGEATSVPDPPLWPQRIAWWERTYRTADPALRESSYGQQFRAAMDVFRERFQISDTDVQAWDARFQSWVRNENIN